MFNVNPIIGQFDAVVRMNTDIRPILDTDLDDLQKLLDSHSSKDPYQRSAGYFAMTGRDGLYKIEKEGSTVLVSRHPNLDNTFLIYPVIGEPNETLLRTTMTTLQRMGSAVQFARFEKPPFQQQKYNDVVAVRETTLDWSYPIHTLNTALVAEHKGGGFQHFRQKHNKLKDTDITAVDLSPELHRNEVIGILTKWSPNEKHDVYMRLLDMFDDYSLAGRVIYAGGQPIGFSIFEKTDLDAGVANAFAHIGLHEVNGASQHVMLDMCETLHREGFDKVCIGGSEDEGLDRFKRNLCPIESVQLNSWYSIAGMRLDHARKLVAV